MSKAYRIVSSAGQSLGIYLADSPADALDQLAKDAGYLDQRDAWMRGIETFDGSIETLDFDAREAL